MQTTELVGSRRFWTAACALAILAVASLVDASSAKAEGALDRIRASGKIKLGYRADARPFSFKDESGSAAGYSVALCLNVVEAIKAEPGLASLGVEWVPVTLENRFQSVKEGKVDLLCGADTATLARRKDVDFSIPIFPGGIGALLRSDSPVRLREVLNGQPLPAQPTWRASATALLREQAFSVVSGTTAADWLSKKVDEFQLSSKIAPVDGYDAGLQKLLDRKADVFFGDRAILLDFAARSASAGKLIVLDRLFTYEPVALALPRGDEDFRLAVDRALSRLYTSGGITPLYARWFGSPDPNAVAFFRWSALPE